jgi:hypothetical protein
VKRASEFVTTYTMCVQLTRVDINGETLSPLTWSLRDGNFAMVQFIIEDLLAIRECKRMHVYCACSFLATLSACFLPLVNMRNLSESRASHSLCIAMIFHVQL